MAKRPGMKEKLLSPEFLADELSGGFGCFLRSISAADPELKPLFIELGCLRKIKALVDFGNDPRNVDVTAVFKRFCLSRQKKGVLKRLGVGAIYVDILTKLGFRIPPTDDVLIFDEEAFPPQKHNRTLYGGGYQNLVAFLEELGS
jgi:hypothetical protein